MKAIRHKPLHVFFVFVFFTSTFAYGMENKQNEEQVQKEAKALFNKIQGNPKKTLWSKAIEILAKDYKEFACVSEEGGRDRQLTDADVRLVQKKARAAFRDPDERQGEVVELQQLLALIITQPKKYPYAVIGEVRRMFLAGYAAEFGSRAQVLERSMMKNKFFASCFWLCLCCGCCCDCYCCRACISSE